jgi:hypothetical protein
MVQTAIAIDEVTAVRQAVNRLIGGDIEPLLNLLPDNVEFEVVGGEDESTVVTDWGQQAVADYFTAIGGCVAFWQVDYTAANQQVIAWGTESFTIGGTDLEGSSEFALVFELSDGLIARLVMLEDLRGWSGVSALEARSAARPTSSPPPRPAAPSSPLQPALRLARPRLPSAS